MHRAGQHQEGARLGRVASGVEEHILLMLPYSFAHPNSYAFAGGGRRERVEGGGRRKGGVYTVITFPLKGSHDLGTYLTNQEMYHFKI